MLGQRGRRYTNINPLTAGAVYIRFLHFFTYQLLNMLKIKSDINQQDVKFVDRYFVKSEWFHSLEVVDRVCETQLHVGENSNWKIWRSKG